MTQNTIAWNDRKFPQFITDSEGNISGLTDDNVNDISLPIVHPYYYFHGYAGSQLAGDSLFFDIAAGNHGVRGANLSDAEMFATSGYITTKAPSNPYDISVHIPNLNFDYSAGEKLLIWWKGKVATPAAQAAVMGDGYNTTANTTGIQLRSTVTGTVYLTVYGAGTAKVGIASTAVVFDNTLHDFAIFLDGENQQYGMWTDGALDTAFVGSYLAFWAGTAFDTKNSNTFNLGAAQPAPGTATLPQGGMATQTRALAILRFPGTYTTPTVASITNAVKALRTNSGKPLLAGAL